MGVFIRKDSPFYWMLLERPRQPALREATKIPVRGVIAMQRRINRQLAEDAYIARMADLARDRNLEAGRSTRSVAAPPRRPTVTHPPIPLGLAAKGWCYLYFLRRDGDVKIGRCANLERRLSQFQTAHAEPLVLMAVTVTHASLEDAIHERFQNLRRTGEWFELTDELKAYIDAVSAGRNPAALLMCDPSEF